MTINLKEIQTRLDLKFKNIQHLKQALVHRSFLNENSSGHLQSNERYEFLGDAVLELWASKTLFDLFPEFPEGKLTNLRSLVVCTQNLSQAAININLGAYVALSKGEEANGGRHNPSILADTFESLIGAIYLDDGFTQSSNFLEKTILPSLKKLASKKIYKDPKSIFQELAQAKQGITPEYKTISTTGPDHQKIFKVGVFLREKLIATGKGKSKQNAAETASAKATKKLENKV